jgi:membrane protease YdiL (CAAX protease family)
VSAAGRLLLWLHADLPPVTAAGRLDAGAVAVPTAAAALFVVSHYQGNTGTWPRLAQHLPDLGAAAGIASHLYWFGATVLFLALAPLAVLWLLGEPFAEYGLGAGHWRLGLRLAALLLALMLPVVLVASRVPAFADHYPLAGAAASSLRLFAVYEAGYALYFVAWEMMFRSFLLFGLYRRVGLAAVYVQALPFALLHFGKPEAEALGSIVAAVALGYLALRTRSFWWGALLHAGVAFSMDVAAAWGRLSGRG